MTNTGTGEDDDAGTGLVGVVVVVKVLRKLAGDFRMRILAPGLGSLEDGWMDG